MYTKKILSAIFLFLFITSTSFAYSPTQKDEKTLNNFYKQIDNLYENSIDSLEEILVLLQQNKQKFENNEKINYLISNTIQYINSKLSNKIITREEADDKYKWDLTQIYENNEEIEADLEKLENIISDLLKYKGQLDDNEKLLEFLKLKDKYIEINDKLHLYIFLKKSIDINDTEADLLNQKWSQISKEYKDEISFYKQELKEFSDERINSLLNNSDFYNYKNIFRDLQNDKAHILSEESENIISQFQDANNGFLNMFQEFIYGDIEYPEIIDPDGNKITVNTASSYSIFVSPNREFKKTFFEIFEKTFKKYENILGNLFISDKKEKTAFAKVKNYNSVLEQTYQNYGLTTDVYDNLINTTIDNLDVFHKYIKLQKDYFGLDKIHIYDTYTPLIENEKKYTYEEAKETLFSGLEKLGEDYIDTLKFFTENRLIDVYGSENKNGVPFSIYSYGFDKPYVLMNFMGTFDDIIATAHELGHAVNMYKIINNQTTVNTKGILFPVEIPSLTNELLLSKQLANNTDNPKEKIGYLSNYMITIQNNFWKGNLYANFERQVYDKIWNNEVVTIDSLNKLFNDLNKQYYGEDFEIDTNNEIGWYSRYHLYRTYYLHEYALSVAIADNIATRIYNEEPGFKEKYLEYLKTGSSKMPNEALKTLGIDLTKKDYLENFMSSQNDIINEMTKLANEIKNK